MAQSPQNSGDSRLERGDSRGNAGFTGFGGCMRGSEGKGKTAEKDAWAAVLGPFPESEVFGVGSGELVDLGHVWAEVLLVRVSSGLVCVWGVEMQTQVPSRVVAWLRPSQAESAEQEGYKLRRRPAE